MFKEIIDRLEKGDIQCITNQVILDINKQCRMFLDGEVVDTRDIYDILVISNILYNNTYRNMLPLEDGIYDLVIAKYNNTVGASPVGAKPIHFDDDSTSTTTYEKHQVGKQTVMRLLDTDAMFFHNIIGSEYLPNFNIQKDSVVINPESDGRSVAHGYPELVGTLDKAKFVTISDAIRHGTNVTDTDSPVVIFERDFMMAPKPDGYNYNDMCITLKYDGISVEADIEGDHIRGARTRGDTANEEATDLSHIFRGMVFKGAREGKISNEVRFGIQFECIITYPMLQLLQEQGLSYANGRTAIIGLTGRNDASVFRDYMTLVPIRTSGLGFKSREVEIQFLNKYYSSGIDLRYAMISGNYMTNLYAVRQFAIEAENMRPYIPFMYDGIVVEYTDERTKRMLGRVNYKNKWSIAIKFGCMVKRSICTGCEFTIGQDGRIVPMAYFNPVEFFGSIHDKTTIHSYRRFKQMNLHVGDIVELEYRNDVIVYLTKPNIKENSVHHNNSIDFPVKCPYCGNQLRLSESGDSCYCDNFFCTGRCVKRCANMLKKLNFKDFGEAYVISLGITSFDKLFTIDYKKACDTIGTIMTDKFFTRLHELDSKSYYDYRLLGSLGFTNVGSEKWKPILKIYSMDYIIDCDDETLYNSLIDIKGVGKETAATIVRERKIFIDDMKRINSMQNIQRSFGDHTRKIVVRFTGIRDEELEEALNNTGVFDASGNKSVTKKTDILIIPYKGYQSNKISKIDKNLCRLMTVDEVWNILKSHS